LKAPGSALPGVGRSRVVVRAPRFAGSGNIQMLNAKLADVFNTGGDAAVASYLGYR